MATLSTASLIGSVDPRVSTQEDASGSENDFKPSIEELSKTSKELADLLHVEETDEKAMIEGFESILFRIDEFKGQLDRVQDRVTSTSETLGELYKETEQLKDVFKKIDDIERFVGVVASSVGEMEGFMERSEKELDQGRMKKVLKALPSFLKPKSLSATPPTATEPKPTPPKVLLCQDFFQQEGT